MADSSSCSAAMTARLFSFFLQALLSAALLVSAFRPVTTRTRTSSHRHAFILHAKSAKEGSSPSALSEGGALTDAPPEFQAWAQEEESASQASFLEEVASIKADNDADLPLPDYMLRLLKEYSKNNPHDINFHSITNNLDDNNPTVADKLPIIAIIGRPNTGKSTLVNKITNSYKDGAIVHDEPGITRDRTYRTGEWNSYNFQVVDTGGIVFEDTEDVFAERITQQALVALQEASAAIMVCDGKAGITPLDQALADWIRKNNKTPLFLAANKCESETTGISQAQEFWGLGLGQPWPVSGIHGTGLNDLLDAITTSHMTKVTTVLKEQATNVALIGRPNVGKSSLFNKLLGADRSIVSDVAGTTRDTVDTLITRAVSKSKPSSNANVAGVSIGASQARAKDSVISQRDPDAAVSVASDQDTIRRYRIVDTAGVRKKGKVEYGAEFFMVNRAFKAIKRADVVVLLLDAIDGIVEQDRILAERIGSEGRSCVIALNKWDAVPQKDDKTYLAAIDNIRSNLPGLRWAQVCLISAQTGQRTEKLLETIDLAVTQFTKRVSTAIINEVVSDATMWMPPPTVGSRAGRIYYAMQVSTAPPTFVLFVNDPALFTENYQKFLERKIRESLDFDGTPIKMIFRGKQLRDVGRAANKGLAGVMGLDSTVRGRVTSGQEGVLSETGRKSQKDGAGLLKDRDAAEGRTKKPRAGR